METGSPPRTDRRPREAVFPSSRPSPLPNTAPLHATRAPGVERTRTRHESKSARPVPVICKGLVLLAAGLFTLAGCVETTGSDVAGGEDFPNSIGPIVASQMDEGGDWNYFDSIQVPESGLPSRRVALPSEGALKKPAAQRAVSQDSLPGDSAVMVLAFATETAAYTRHDTIWVRRDSLLEDDVPDNENIVAVKSKKIFTTGRIEIFSITDRDGDGVAAGAPEFSGAVRIEADETTILGVNIRNILDVDAGPDRDFDTEEDNRILYASQERTRRGERIGYTEFADADGDDFVVDGGTDSGVVDVVLEENRDYFNPFAPSGRAAVRLVVFPADSTRNYPIRYLEERTWQSGARRAVRILGRGPDSTLVPNDTATVEIRLSRPEPDSGSSKVAVFKIGTGEDLRAEEDNSLYGFRITAGFRYGNFSRVDFQFSADEPILNGREPHSGSIHALLETREGVAFTVDATFSEGEFSATWESAEGRSGEVTWNRLGEVVRP